MFPPARLTTETSPVGGKADFHLLPFCVVEYFEKVLMQGRLAHDVKSNFFADIVSLEFSYNPLGEPCFHIPVRTFHFRLGAKYAIEVANIGQLNVYPL